MKKIAGIFAVLALSTVSHAADIVPEQTLDKVVFQVSGKQWVTTQTALLQVNVNVTLNNADLVKARSEVMDQLNKIASGEWHITQFDRSQDSSGLEKLFVQAEARVSQGVLTDVYKNAKSVSKPGANYKVAAVEFKPSLEEVQKVRAKLREQLYKQANDEIARINKIYSGQSYSVYRLVLAEGDKAPQPKAYARTMALATAPVPAVTVSNQIVMSAMVEAASNRQMEN